MPKQYVNIDQLSAECGIQKRQIRTLMAKHKLPYLRLGHRTILFDPDKVRAALERFEVKSVG